MSYFLKRKLCSEKNCTQVEGDANTPSKYIKKEQDTSSVTLAVSDINKKERESSSSSIISTDISESETFLRSVKRLISCSVCSELGRQCNQCTNGHLTCLKCIKNFTPNIKKCPICKEHMPQDLKRTLIADQVINEFPSKCKFCGDVMAFRFLNEHEQKRCSLRPTTCPLVVFGCDWMDKAEMLPNHETSCRTNTITVNDVKDSLFRRVNDVFKHL